METNIGMSKELKISDLVDRDCKEMEIIDAKEDENKRIFYKCVKIKHIKLKEYKCLEEGMMYFTKDAQFYFPIGVH